MVTDFYTEWEKIEGQNHGHEICPGMAEKRE
jgi:hypothetical protein